MPVGDRQLLVIAFVDYSPIAIDSRKRQQYIEGESLVAE